MLFSTALFLLFTTQSASADEGVVKLQLHKPGLPRTISSKAASDNDSTADVSLLGKSSMFAATLVVGSDKQNVTVQVDTGSSDLWLMSASNPYCEAGSDEDQGTASGFMTVYGRSLKAKRASGGNNVDGDDDDDDDDDNDDDEVDCDVVPTQFDANSSTTFHRNSTPFSLSYLDGTSANGTFAQDTVRIGDLDIENANFAFVDEADTPTSVFGIGLTGSEGMVTSIDDDGNYTPTYANLPVQMVEQGLIAKRAYSLWLDYESTKQAELLFGGVDHSKYNGTLQTLPLISTNRGASPDGFFVILDEISVFQGSHSQQIVECELPALLDSGTTRIGLPVPFFEAVLESIGGVYTEAGESFAECGIDGGLTFNFGGIEIDVPFEALLFTVPDVDACLVGIQPLSDQIVLGDTFLGSAYVVYDLDNLEVAMAQAVSQPGSAQVEAITGTIPSAKQAKGYSSTNVNYSSYQTSIASFLTAPTGTTASGSAVSTEAITDATARTTDSTSELADSATSRQATTSPTAIASSASTSPTSSASSASSTSAQSSTTSKSESPSSASTSGSSSSKSKNGSNPIGVDAFSCITTGLLGLLMYL